MGKRSLINSYRYSIPGYPCLYLSTGVEMCWFECGMPKHFSYSAFKLNASDEQPINLINFSIAPVDFISTIVCCYNNCKTCNERTYLNNLILKYLVSFPLRAACSISVINRNVPFIEEYIFPQQLLLWLRDKLDFDGILYRTCSAIESAYNWNYINLVMPAKCIRGSYCENLTHMFELTPPVKVDVNKSLLKYSNKIDDVKKCLKMIESSIWKQIDGGNENDYIYFHMRKSDGSYISVLDHGRIVETPQYGRVFYVMFIDCEDIHIHYSDLII